MKRLLTVAGILGLWVALFAGVQVTDMGGITLYEISTKSLASGASDTLSFSGATKIERFYYEPNFITAGIAANTTTLEDSCQLTIQQGLTFEGPWTCGSGVAGLKLYGATPMSFDCYGLCSYFRIIVKSADWNTSPGYQIRIVFPRGDK